MGYIMNEVDDIRIDKWLKTARIFKKREDAADAVENGMVKLNGIKVKPSKNVIPGDKLTVKIDSKYKTLIIKTITKKSLSSSLARELYEFEKPAGVTPEMEETIRLLEEQENAIRKSRKGKPNKKERRDINKFKYGD